MKSRNRQKDAEGFGLFGVPQVPELTCDRSGRLVHTSDSIWKINDDVKIAVLDWKSIPLGDGPILRTMQHFAIESIPSKSPATIKDMFGDLKFCMQKMPDKFWMKMDQTNAEEVERCMRKWMHAIVNALTNDDRLHRFSYIRQWFSSCTDLWPEYGFSPELDFLIQQIKVPNNPTGFNVHSDAPDVGPLLVDEVHALNIALAADECNERNSLRQRCAVRLSLGYGRNPRNFCLLMGSDLVNLLGNTEPSAEGWVLHIPRIKKTGIKHGRQMKKIEYCSEEIVRSILEIRTMDEKVMGKAIDLPLFNRLSSRNHENFARRGLTEMCLSTSEFSLLLKAFVKRMGVPSRTSGELLHLTPRRLRYTFATHLAKQGVPRKTLADMLDHSTVESVAVYYAFGADMLKLVDEALGPTGHKLQSFFTGVPVERSEAINGSRPEMQIQLHGKGGTSYVEDSSPDAGSCSREKPSCRLDIPLACYDCHKYEPYLHGPHHRALALAEERLAEHRGFKDAEAQLLVVIDRIKLVMTLCAERKGKHETE